MEYGCIGEKLTHSFSKEIHGLLFDYSYELVELSPTELASFFTERNFKAINVTIPYKKAVIPFLDWVDEVASAIGAVNTIVNRNGKLYGYNTDFAGMTALFEQENIVPAGKKVLILGSGGTSNTAFAVAKALQASEVLRVSRRQQEGFITYEQATKNHSDAQIIINTTPCGMYPNIGQSPIDISYFPQLSGVVDAIYNPLRSALVCAAGERRIPATGGLFMLVAQGVFAAEKFTDTKIPAQKITEVYTKIAAAKQNIVLIGMPGCGKTTVGSMLAKQLGMDFIDTDRLIAERQKQTIPEIFARYGEAEFRKMESEIIKEVSARQHCVIATGGGAVLNPENIALLKENGRLYFLNRPLENLAMTADRPLSSDFEKLKNRYEERYDLYCDSADKIINCSEVICENASWVKEDFTRCEF